jgi:hypothetical protein
VEHGVADGRADPHDTDLTDAFELGEVAIGHILRCLGRVCCKKVPGA